MNMSTYSFDVSGIADFEQRVLEESFNQPVLVDFWAQWCAPCKALLPVLEKITASYQGQLLLARVDCDAEPAISGQFGIRSLPTVVLFKDGQPLDGFTGAQPESAIRQLLEAHLSLPVMDEDPLQQAQSLFDNAQFAQAENLLEGFLATHAKEDIKEQDKASAQILYGKCLAERGALDEAEKVLAEVKADGHKKELAGARAQLAFLRQSRDLPEAALLKSRLAQNPADSEAALQLAIHQLARQQYEAAMAALFALFLQSRKAEGENHAHKTLLQVFDLLGNEHPLVASYRRKLYQALY